MGHIYSTRNRVEGYQLAHFPPTMAPTKTPTGEKYPPGAIAAIVICTLLFFSAVAFLIYYYQKPSPDPVPQPDPSYGGGGDYGGGYGGGGAAKLEAVQSKLEAVQSQRTTYDV